MAQRQTRDQQSKGQAGLGLVFALLLAGALVLLAPIYLAERRISPLVTGTWASGSYPTRIYSAPHRIRAGEFLSSKELQERLERLRYARVSGKPRQSGEYRMSDGLFDIALRGFSHPFVSSTSAQVEIEISGDKIRSVRLAGSSESNGPGAPLVEAALEPELLYEVSGEKKIRREPLALHDIPPAMTDAVVAIEDRRFYQHYGIDLRGMLRAAAKNLRKGRVAEGGSTLTQQLARNVFLTPKRTLWRKTQEALIAVYIEARFSKREILRMYLDTVYFGQDGPVSVMGLVAAARHFFDKKPGDLTLGECALLAGMLQSPLRYNPFRYPDEALDRRSLVLAAMRKEGYISPADEAQAKLEPLKVTRAGQRKALLGDYFVSYVQKKLSERYGDEALFTRGLTIHTTLDPWLQELAQQAVKTARYQAALVALEPGTGAIRALVGGTDFLISPFDRATQARRQPGSAFKPFVYGTALADPARRWTPISVLSDTRRQFRVDEGFWTPKNYDGHYHGRVTLREALAKSLNVATVNLAAEIGPNKIIDYARNLGISSPLKPELGLALGVCEVTLLELTGAYCAFANGGSRIEPYPVDAVEDSTGEILEYHSPQPHAVLSPSEAYLMTNLLHEVVKSGTAQSLKRWDLDAIASGKTGTTSEGKDAWFIGYTPFLIAGVWTGTDLPAGLELSGASAAIPMWANFMQAATPSAIRTLREAWPRPDGVVAVDVDPESGLKARAGCPRVSHELFLAGSEPSQFCPIHQGGVIGWLRKMFKPESPARSSP